MEEVHACANRRCMYEQSLAMGPVQPELMRLSRAFRRRDDRFYGVAVLMCASIIERERERPKALSRVQSIDEFTMFRTFASETNA